jgi:hypothetical protein
LWTLSATGESFSNKRQINQKRNRLRVGEGLQYTMEQDTAAGGCGGRGNREKPEASDVMPLACITRKPSFLVNGSVLVLGPLPSYLYIEGANLVEL